MATKEICEIAREIKKNGKTFVAAKPYLDAMLVLRDKNSAYGYDSAKSVVLYFLANASTFRGPKAKS